MRKSSIIDDRSVANGLARGEAGGEGTELRLTCLANLACAAHDAALSAHNFW